MSNNDNFDEIIDDLTNSEYKYGFTTEIETEYLPKGLSEEAGPVRFPRKKVSPEWLDFRLKAMTLGPRWEMPDWAQLISLR